MRELTIDEIFEVGGAGPLNFTTPVTSSMLNNVANATTVGRMLSLSFGFGYAIGSYLNATFGLSTKIVDYLSE
jgi:hypothetical protein